MTTRTELNAEVRAVVGRMLCPLLADEYLLYQIARDYHWNVTGPDYYSLRLQFWLQHEEAAIWVDEVTERIRLLHLDTRIGWDELKNSARCSAAAGRGLPPEEMLSGLLRIHNETILRLRSDSQTCRDSQGDVETADFFDRLREKHENAAWMLRAQLEPDVR